MKTIISLSKKLSAEDRSKMKPSDYGLPDEEKYPMPDASHAANAKVRAKQQLDKGRLSKADYEKIVKKADGILESTSGVISTAVNWFKSLTKKQQTDYLELHPDSKYAPHFEAPKKHTPEEKAAQRAKWAAEKEAEMSKPKAVKPKNDWPVQQKRQFQPSFVDGAVQTF